MATYQYPENRELQEVEQDLLPVLLLDDPIFEFMPIVEIDSHLLEWEQEDNYFGLQQLRGLDGQPGNVRAVGGKGYRAEPGVYGDFLTIDEEELTKRRQWGTFATPVNVTDLVRRRQDLLLSRRISRIRYVAWKLVTAGLFITQNRHGVIHTDQYTMQTYNASAWGTPTTATPLADFRGAQLLSRGHSVSFGASATAFMNRTTSNKLLANTNAADLGGKRTSGLANILSIAETNNVLGMEDLPQLRIFDDTYQDDAGATQLFIPNDVVAIIGRRSSGARIMDYAMTRNANNPDSAPGAYVAVVDHATDGPAKQVPPTIEVHDGHNGGPRLYLPSSIIIMDVS